MNDVRPRNNQPTDAVDAWVSSPVTALIKKHKDIIETVARGVLDEQRVMRLIRAAIMRDNNILLCSPISVLNAILHITYCGLEISPDQAYVLAFKSSKDGGKMVATPVIAYQGMIRVAANSGIVFDDPQIIYRNEKLTYYTDEQGTHFRHEPMIFGDDDERGKPIGAYVVTRWGNTAKITLMRADEIIAIEKAALARTNGTGPWKDNRMAMWKKSVVRRSFKTVPRPTDPEAASRILRIQELDNSVDLAELPEPLIQDSEAENAGPMVPQGSAEAQQVARDAKLEQLKKSTESRQAPADAEAARTDGVVSQPSAKDSAGQPGETGALWEGPTGYSDERPPQRPRFGRRS